MALTNVAAARRLGFKLENEDIADPDTGATAIAMSKIGTRTLYLSFPSGTLNLDGASVANATDGVFVYALLPDANAGDLYFAFAIPVEWESGDMVVTVYWYTSAVTGNVKYTLDTASKTTGETTASADTQSVITAVPTVANQVTVSSLTPSNSIYAAGDIVGMKLRRDPTDAADTAGADVKVLCIVVSFTGRG